MLIINVEMFSRRFANAMHIQTKTLILNGSLKIKTLSTAVFPVKKNPITWRIPELHMDIKQSRGVVKFRC